jgi:hypothetical protein
MSQATPAADRSHEGLPPPARVFTLTLVQVTSIVFVTMRKRPTASSGNTEDLRALYRRVLLHNLLLGWWGFPFGLVWTPVALASNRRALSSLRSLMTSGSAPPGWHPDPTGRHQSRYWDGQRWTDQVSDPNVQSDPPSGSGT